MDTSRPDLAERIEMFVGRACRQAKAGLAQSLHLEFEAPPGWEDDQITPLIATYSSAWRIVKAGMVLSGQYDDEDYGRTIEPALEKLKGLTLTGVELHPGLPDARFTFSGGLTVEFFAIGRHVEAWEAYLPNAKWMKVGPDATWREVASDDPGQELTADERRVSDHARAFSHRWQSRMPPPSPPGRWCAECAYWQRLPGIYDFYDFGVCSNACSSFDGTLMFLRMGCRRFSRELEQPPLDSP